MLRDHCLPSGWAPSLVFAALCAAVPCAFAQAEVAGGAARHRRTGAEEHLGAAGAARRCRQGQRQLPALEHELRADPVLPGRADQHHATSPSCGRHSSSRPRCSSRWRRRRSSSTASCTSRPRTTTCTRSTPRPARSSGTTSTRWVRSRPSAAARTTAASRSWATASTWERSTPSCSRSTPRPARCSGRRRSPTPRRATRRRWRRSPSTARC